MAIRHISLLLMAVVLLVACNRRDEPSFMHKPMRSVYHWRTTFDPTPDELAFMGSHGVGRLYIHYFDVVLRDDNVIPEATVLFRQTPADTLEVVPTVYITIEAIRQLSRLSEGSEYPDTVAYDYASRIVKRITAINAHNHITGVHEVQIDCDWTSSTKKTYFMLLANIREQLHRQGMALSVTVRLHQLRQAAPPADMGVLMLYNTGNLMSEKTHNSILDIDDVKPYFNPGTHYSLPLDFAYPIFGWKTCYRDGKFVMLTSPQSPVPGDCTVRREQPDFATIWQVKQLAEATLAGGSEYSTIIYHLDQQFFNTYSDEQMEHIFGPR